MNFFEYLCTFLIATLCAGTTFAMVILWSGWFSGSCPRFRDRECNNRGTCQFSQCICDPEFSGIACQESGIPGYQKAANIPCNGRGLYLPYIRRNNLNSLCQETQPTFFNGFVREGPGMEDVECIRVLAQNRKRIYQRVASNEEVLQTPLCICRAPFVGDGCEYDGSPIQIATNLPCSGNGNLTVGYMNNFTSGNGVQCQKRLALKTLLQAGISAEARRMITTDVVQLLAEGVCAEILGIVEGYPVIVPVDSYLCLCDAKHFGPVCEFRLCPGDEDGRTCSGNGHKSFGFGAEKNTTRSVSEFDQACSPVCAPDKKKCRDQCLSSDGICRATFMKCPIDLPMRCPDMDCAANKPDCSTNYVHGYFDDPMRGLRDYTESTFLDSDIRFMTGFIGVNGSVTYNNETINTPGSFIRTFNTTLLEFERDMFQDGDLVSVNEVQQFSPSPFENKDGIVPAEFEVMRLYNAQVGYVVIDLQSSFVSVGDGTSVIANISANEYMRPDGVVVTAQDCYDDFAACKWNVDLVSPDGSKKLCTSPENQLVSVPVARPCSLSLSLVGLQRAQTVVNFVPRLNTFDLDGVWMLQKQRQHVPKLLDVKGSVSNLRIATTNSLRVECVCYPPRNDQAATNRKWYNSVSRAVTTTGHAVAQVPISGNVIYERGTMVSEFEISTQFYGVLEIIPPAKHITQNEFRKGQPTCVDEVHPLRCADFSCAALTTHIYPNASVECQCTLRRNRVASCLCDDGINTEQCECSVLGCSCFRDDAFAGTLFNQMQLYGVNQSCFVVSPNADWKFVAEVVLQGCNSSTLSGVNLEGFILDKWQYAPHVAQCNAQGNTILIPQLYKSPYTDFRVVNRTLVDLVRVPYGVSAYLVSNYTLSASFNEANASNVVSDDFTVWTSDADEHSFLRVTFDHAVHFVGAYVVFQTVGFEVAGYGNHTAQVQVQGGSINSMKRASWKTLNTTASDVIDGHLAVFVPFDYYGESLRLFSAFPMSVRRFVPLTNQNCHLGEIIVQPTSVYPQTRNNSFDTRTFPNCSCTCTDDCVIEGVPVYKNGICEDFRFITKDVAFENVTDTGFEYTADTILIANITEADEFYFFEEDGFYIWSLLNVSFNTSTFTQSPALIRVVNESTYAYISKHPLIAATRNSLIINATFVTKPGYVQGGNTCNDGTDCSDCGNSCRERDLDPDLQCDLSPYQLRLKAYLENTSSIEFNYLLETDELLDRNFNIKFNVTLNRDVWVIGKGPCGDCDGKIRCSNGECVSFRHECSQSLFDCPGDGCVQTNVNRKQFKCVCGATHSGLDCSFTECLPLDTATGLVDPHRVCSCSSSPPLKLNPRTLLTEQKERIPIDSNKVLTLNRRTPRRGTNDVGWVNVQADFAPFGYPFYRTYFEGGVLRYTNCPYVVIDPNGIHRSLEECVQQRSPEWPHVVTKWRQFTMLNGSRVEYVWGPNRKGKEYETRFDDAPHRCTGPKYFGCVATERECFNEGERLGVCGFRGKCLVDGSCECDSETETWVVNEHITKIARFPYNAANPIQWGKRNPTEFANVQCNARNCSVVDCSPPVTCFAGTPALFLADRLIACDEQSGHYGFCGVDPDSCKRGDVVDPIPCSGNGIMRKVDYRDEWRCECGTPKSNLVNSIVDIRTTPELTPNGFGGFGCSQYTCSEQKSVYFQRQNSKDGGVFFDADGLPLPGRWFGPCGAPAGPSPDDLPQWHACCPGIKRLEKCENVLCEVGTLYFEKVTKCMPIKECTGFERRPKIYTCNNYGTALADGQCNCNRDEDQGTGYTYDKDVFQYEGCFRPIRCALALDGSVCNKKPTCGAFEYWPEFPYIPYAENQAYAFLFRQGKPMTNESLVKTIAEGLDDYNTNVLQVSMVQIATQVQAAIRQVATTICVLSANESSANPPGMVPYVGLEDIVGPYRKGFKKPHLLDLRAVGGDLNFLRDGMFFTKPDGIVENVHAIRVNRTFTSNSVLQFNLSGAYTISAIRVHAIYDQSLPVTAVLQFSGDSGFICRDMDVPSAPELTWHGASLGVYCIPSFRPYNFKRSKPTDFLTQCQEDETAELCTTWKDEVCVSVGGEVNTPGNYLEMYIGCNNERCCIPVTPESYLPTTTFSITLAATPLSDNHSVLIDELQVYGFPNQVLEAPQGLKDYIKFVDGTSGSCMDERFIFNILGFDHAFFTYINYTAGATVPSTRFNYSTAEDACKERGGYLATLRGLGDTQRYAEPMGVACQTGECIIGARNRFERPVAIMTDFFLSSCSVWGCWTPQDQTISKITRTTEQIFLLPNRKFVPDAIVIKTSIDYVSAPGDDGGAQYQLDWTGGLVLTWNEMVHRQLINVYMQNSENGFYGLLQKYQPFKSGTQMITSNGILDGIPAYYDRNAFSANERNALSTVYCPACTGCPLVNNRRQCCNYDSYRCAFAQRTSHPDGFRANTQPAPSKAELEQKFPSKVYSYWTNPRACAISLYSEENCGRGLPDNQQSDPYGCVHTIYIQPSDDYAYLRGGSLQDLRFETFQQCASFPNDLTRNCNCKGRLVLGNIQSISITGPCQVRISGQYQERGNNRFKMVLARGGRASQHRCMVEKPVEQFFYTGNANGVLTTPCGRGLCRVQFATHLPSGCHSQFCRDRDCSSPTDRKGRTNNAIHGWPRPVPQYGECDTGTLNGDGPADVKGIIDEVYVIPLFRTRKVHVHLRTQEVADPPGGLFSDNAFYMARNTHPYMCSNIEVLTSAEMVGGYNPYRLVLKRNYYEMVMWKRGALEVIEESNPFAPLVNPNADDVQEDFNRVMDSEMVVPVLRCDGVQLPKLVRKCRTCLVPQPPGDWQQNQQFLNPQNAVFESRLLFIRQTSIDNADPVSATIYVRFDSVLGSRDIVPLNSLEFGFPKAYARLISNLQTPDYKRLSVNRTHPGFFLDYCVKVVHDPAQVRVQYRFEPTVCELENHAALCVYDFQKYVIKSGRQCDECGPSSCLRNGICKGETAFSLYPLANRDLFPYEHSLLDAYLTGSLNTLIETEPVDYDVIMKYLLSLNQSFVFAFPQAREMLYNGRSDRPGRTSRGLIPDPYAWADMDWKSWFPYDKCPTFFSKITGISREVCAASAQFCNPESSPPFEAKEMAIEDVPTVFKPFTGDATREPSCGKQVVLETFFTRDIDGGPAPASSAFAVLEASSAYIILRFFTTSGSVRNTGKTLRYVFRDNDTVTGQIVCPTSCNVTVWVATLNPFYSDPVSLRPIGVSTGGLFSFTIAGLSSSFVYQILGFTVNAIAAQGTIKFFNPLVTNTKSIQECSRPRGPKMVETPAFTYSAHPKHSCVYTPEEARRLDTKTVGVCYAADSSPWGGVTNEYPTVISDRGKNVCNMYGDSNSVAFDAFGARVPVQTGGAFVYDTTTYQCKCRWNAGEIILTSMRPASAFDFLYVLRTDTLPNTALFQSFAEDTVVDDYGLSFPTSFVDSGQVCATESSLLPSFISAEEFVEYLRQYSLISAIHYNEQPTTFMDFGWDAEGNLRWLARKEAVQYCSASVSGLCGTAVTNLCADEDLCDAYNFNNLAYKKSPQAFMTDGVNQNSSFASNDITIPITLASNGVTVEIWSLDASSPFSVFTNGSVLCNTVATDTPTRYDFDCDHGPVSSIRIQRGVPSLTMSEVMVFNRLDTSRAVGVF